MRLEQLTFTRFLAAISIVVFHFGADIFPFDYDWIKVYISNANIGVSYFFILSGFVIIIATSGQDYIRFSNFVKRRFSRIFPAFFFSILLLLVYKWRTSQQIDFRGVFLNITFLQSWIPGYALSHNGPGWSLSVEMFFYILFPLAFNYIYKKCSILKLVIFIAIFYSMSQIGMNIFTYSSFYHGFPSRSHDFIYYFPILHLNEFLIGNLVGLLYLKKHKVKSYDFHILCIITLIFLVIKFNPGVDLHNGIMAFLFVPLIYFTASNNGFLARCSNNEVLVFLGEISFGIYIYQMPIFKWMTYLLHQFDSINPVLIFYLSLSVLVIFSAVSYKFVEVPVRSAINKFSLT